MALIPTARSRGRRTADASALLPELGMIGWDRFTRARPEGLGEHRHGGYELCLLVRGHVDWQVAGEIVAVGAGACFLTRPGERHGGVDEVMHPCELFWLHLDLDRAGLAVAERNALAQALADGPRTWPAHPGAAAGFTALLDEVERPGPLAALAVRSHLYRLLVAALRARHAQAPVAGPSAPIRDALALLASGTVTIADAARAVGLGPSRFYERCQAEIGATPQAWLTLRRIEQAKAELRSGATVAAAAGASGFSSRSHFSAVFLQATGLSPAAWRDVHGSPAR